MRAGAVRQPCRVMQRPLRVCASSRNSVEEDCDRDGRTPEAKRKLRDEMTDEGACGAKEKPQVALHYGISAWSPRIRAFLIP